MVVWAMGSAGEPAPDSVQAGPQSVVPEHLAALLSGGGAEAGGTI